MSSAQSSLARQMTSFWPFLYFKWMRLPSLLFWRVRVAVLDQDICRVTIPYRRSTQNPFGSIYFAAQAGAGELSTGALILMHTVEKSVSMLVVKSEMTFVKKAKGLVTFSCLDGQQVASVVGTMKASGDAAEITLRSTGVDAQGDTVCTMDVLWSLKCR